MRYTDAAPAWLEEFCAVEEMRRLKNVGMNCGCEYTNFPRFRGLPPYSRYRHSRGTAEIVWHFTGSMEQTLAALFHDISTPVFAHTIDFLHGDYLHQEYTEGETERIIRRSRGILRLLEKYGVAPETVTDYHRYPVADNDAPRLSADRLEYTLGNLQCYRIRTSEEAQRYYDAICVEQTPEGAPELAFLDVKTALAFAQDALQMSRIYVADEDRYAMQRLSEVIACAQEKRVLDMTLLYTTEPEVIARLESDAETAALWKRYCALHEMLSDPAQAPERDRRVIPAKKRCIDPYVSGQGRLSAICPDFRAQLQEFRNTPQTQWLCAR